MTAVLITGGAGFIGSHLADRLLAEGRRVIVLDDLTSGSLQNLPRSHPRLTVICDRVQNVQQHRERLASVQLVYHLAACISGHDSMTQADDYVDTNIRGTLRLLELCAGLDRPRVVFASSSTVYGDGSAPGVVRHEEEVPQPLTVYAATKIAGEHLLRSYAGLYGYSYTALRLFNVYGPRQNPEHPYANVTCKWAHAAAKRLPIRVFGDGSQTRDFVYIDDVVEAFLLARTTPSASVFNVGTGVNQSIAGLMRMLETIAARPFEVERLPAWINDIHDIRADCSRLRDATGFAPATSLEQGLRQTYAWFLRSARDRASIVSIATSRHSGSARSSS
jgi:UDP-glucose 4-epimerase